MRSLLLASAVTILVTTSVFAEDPGVPSGVTVSVDAATKQLIFDWKRDRGATHYQLQFKPDASSSFAPLGGPIQSPRTRARVNIAVHQLNWAEARYRVSACDAWGCKNSADIAVTDQMLAAVGTVRASNAEAGDIFGTSTRLSQDGNTLVVFAREDSNATGVNGDESNNYSTDSGAVYVYRRAGGEWRQEAYLKAGVNQPAQSFGWGEPVSQTNIGISADGSFLAIGAPQEAVNSVQFSGAVYLFSRAADGSWSAAGKLTQPAPERYDFFGSSVDLSDDGSTLKIQSINPRDGEGNSEGRTHIYARSASGAFALENTLSGPANDFCSSKMSGDAGTVILFCYSYENPGPSIKTFKRAGAGWVAQPDTAFTNFSSQEPALSDDGRRLAFRITPVVLHDEVVVYRWTDAGWTLDATITPSAGSISPFHTFGDRLAFNRNGNVLAIGDPYNANGGAGVSEAPLPGDAGEPEANHSGAVFLYERRAGQQPRWALTEVVKSAAPAFGDCFGISISLSGNGRTLAVGARGDDGAGEDAGAVFLY